MTGQASTAAPLRVVIADSRPIFRDGLRRLLETDPGLRIVGESDPIAGAAALVRELAADLLVLSFSAPAAFDILRSMAASGAVTKTILLADSVEDPDLTTALELGAHGLVLKDSAEEMLFKSIHSVLGGHYWIASDRAADQASSLRKLDAERRRRRAFGLTRRELEIVQMVVAGHANKEIAERLSIGENTVKSHLTHIFDKLGASSRIELALFAAHHGMLDAQQKT